MDRRLPWVLIATWLLVGATGSVALRGALEGSATALVWTLTVEGVALWAVVWVAMLLPRVTTLTVTRLGVPLAVGVGVASLIAGGATPWAIVCIVAALAALAALAHPATIDSFIDGSSYGPEQRFGLRTPPLSALLAIPPTWLVAVAITIVPPLAVTGNLVVALIIGVGWVLGIRWSVRSLHLPARRWVVFVPAGMVLSDPLVLTDRMLFPRRSITTLGPAYADTDATDLSQGALGLALQIDLSEPFAFPLIDEHSLRDRNNPGERTVTTDRFVFSVLRPGALLTVAAERRFTLGETIVEEPRCVHHGDHEHAEAEPTNGESQTAVPLPRTRSPR